jgi:hypothetical protein
MFRIIAALFLLLASAAASSAQGLFPSVWQSQRGALLKILAVDPATGNFTGVFISGPAGTCPGVPYDLAGRVRGSRVDRSQLDRHEQGGHYLARERLPAGDKR